MKLAFGEYVLDKERRELGRSGAQIAIEPQVFDLLLYLVQNRDRVVSKDDLLASVWCGRIVSEFALASRVAGARQAIGDSGERQQFIRTYARKGFRFVGDVSVVDELTPAHIIFFPDLQVNQTGGQHARHDRPPAWGGRPCVAVLPFNNLSGDAGQEYFSDGFTEDIITSLSKYRSLAVIARNSTFAYREASTDVRQIGLALGADYLVEGSLRKFGQRVRVTAQLAETESGQEIWADRYDRDVSDLFRMQDEIIERLAARIEPEINAAERRRVERKAVPALHAWDFFRLGTKHFHAATAADNLEAQRLFRRAIELDPSLAAAHGYLCYALVLGMVYFDVESSEAHLSEAVAIGRRGVELDEQDALVRFMHGRALLACKAYGDAIAELKLAVDLNPCMAVSYCGLGDSLTYEGRFSEAIACFERAIDLSPFDPMRWAFYSYRALAHLLAGQFEEALEWSHRATRIPNAHFTAFAHQVSALGHLGRDGVLPTAIGELLRRRPDYTCNLARKGLFYVKQPQQIETYIEGLRKAGITE